MRSAARPPPIHPSDSGASPQTRGTLGPSVARTARDRSRFPNAAPNTGPDLRVVCATPPKKHPRPCATITSITLLLHRGRPGALASQYFPSALTASQSEQAWRLDEAAPPERAPKHIHLPGLAERRIPTMAPESSRPIIRSRQRPPVPRQHPVAPLPKSLGINTERGPHGKETVSHMTPVLKRV
jgi:hypothetical protein